MNHEFDSSKQTIPYRASEFRRRVEKAMKEAEALGMEPLRAQLCDLLLGNSMAQLTQTGERGRGNRTWAALRLGAILAEQLDPSGWPRWTDAGVPESTLSCLRGGILLALDEMIV